MRPEKSFKNLSYALTGIKIVWLQELNFKIQVGVALLTLLLGWYVGLTKVEFLTVIFMIGFVMTAEVFNTALEELCDKFQPEHDPHIGKIKDLAAAAVLVSSITAVIIGIAIYLPYFSAWIPLEVVDGI